MYRFAAIIVLFSMGCQAELSDDRIQAIQEEVAEASNRFISVTETMDIEGVEVLVSEHPHFVFASNGSLFGPRQYVLDEVLPNWATSAQSQDIEVERSTITVLSEDVAIQSLAGQVTAIQPSGTVTPSQRFVSTIVWHKTDAGWQLLHIHESLAPMP
jgi:SnoaL-like domain